MDAVEKLRKDRILYRYELGLLKILPILIALICFMNTLLSLFGIDLPVLSYLGGVSFIPLIFMYLSSYVFKFCEYHRMFLHYVVLNNILNIIDLYVTIPITIRAIVIIHILLFGICLFVILYLYLKSRRNEQFNRPNS